jgi:single-strand DNA-binding protein
MSSVNKAILVGRLGRDPEGRATAGGSKVVRLNVATDEVWSDQRGERQKRTEWHRIVVFGKTAENCERYLKKGSLVYVEGRLQTQEWQDKTGAKRYTTEIVANDVKFLDSAKSSGGGGDSDVHGGDGNDGGASPEDDSVPF